MAVGGDGSTGASWPTAFTNIQDGLAAATVAGDTVLVSNGTYAITTTLALTDAITVMGFHGASNTTISCQLPGSGTIPAVHVNHGGATFRGFKITDCIGQFTYNYWGPLKLDDGLVEDCIITGNRNVSIGGGYVGGGLLRNCTIYNNSAYHQNTGFGGGLRVAGGVVSNCVITQNFSVDGGGGIYQTGGSVLGCEIFDNLRNGGYDSRVGGGVQMTAGLIANCLIYSNRLGGGTSSGAGLHMSGGSAANCTIVDNRRLLGDSFSGLYMSGGAATNCITYYNGSVFPASGSENFFNSGGGTFVYSCAQPLISDTGNISDNPSFVNRGSNDYHLSFGSGCIDAGTVVPGVTVDLDGETRPKDGDGDSLAKYDMGCYEAADAGGIFGCSFTGAPLIGTNSLQTVFTATVVGPGTGTVTYVWDFDNDGTAELSGTQYRQATNTYASPGFYTVKLRCTNALSETSEKIRSEYVQVWSLSAYVALGAGSVAPYDTWAKATANPQDAINAVADGGTVYVSNGVYSVASKLNVVRAMTVTGINGASNTVLRSPGPNRLMDITHAGVTVEKLSFTGVSMGYPNSGAIAMTGGTLRYCNVTNNGLGTAGGGIHMEGGLVHDCLIARNGANHQNTGTGGGVYLTAGVVSNCQIVGNQSWNSGGGVYITGGRVTECVITNNFMYGFYGTDGGGGALMTGGVLENCLLAHNSLSHLSALLGGGVYMSGGAMVHCTVADNARAGGDPNSGLYMTAGTVTNSIFFYNSPTFPASGNENVFQSGGTIVYSCAQPAVAGAGNIGTDPSFADRSTNNYHLGSGSPCIDTATNGPALTLDLDGNPRPTDGDGDMVDEYDMGCYEREASGAAFECSFVADALSGTNSLQAVFTASVLGPGTNSVTYHWDWADDGTNDLTTANRVVTNLYNEPGSYSVRLTAVNSLSETATVTRVAYLRVWALVAYASLGGAGEFPYHTWAKATPSVEAAFNAVAAGGTVHIGDGTFEISARMNVQKPLTITSVNGASNTTLHSLTGAQIFSLEHPDALIEGLLLRGARLSYYNYGVAHVTDGTIRNCIITDNIIGSCGGVRLDGGLMYDCVITNNNASHQNTGFGGGVQITDGVVSNCVIMDNRASDAGGGVSMSGGTVVGCTISGNTKNGPNAGLTRAGGGVRMTGGTLVNCLVQSNLMAQAATQGGGLYVSAGAARNLLVSHNTSTIEGAGVYVAGGVLESATVVANEALSGGGAVGGLYMTGGAVSNCVIASNVSAVASLEDIGGPVTNVSFSLSPALEAVNGNIVATPAFQDAALGDYRLPYGTPGVNAGSNQSWMDTATDLDGLSRIIAGVVDMGAYEAIPPAGTMFIVR